jgi:hypothetical protein
VALTLSLAVFVHGRWRDKRDLLLRLHDQLVSAEKQKGRRLLYKMGEQQLRMEDLSDDDYLLINNTLAALNVLGIYYQRRYVNRKDVLEIWALTLVRTLLGAERFLASRECPR